jgi:ubiquinone/menaquinone biosynthesis C-methylase UbiE
MATGVVDWTAYAQAYDRMAENNPAYQEIVELCLETLAAEHFKPGDVIVDLGAGTGNFSTRIAAQLPQCTVLHVDADPGMCVLARGKATQAGLRNHLVINKDAHHADFTPGSLKAVVSVHSLYAMHSPRVMIESMAHWIAPGGLLFACDPGRPMDLTRWTAYVLRETARRKGLAATARLIWDARNAIGANRRIGKCQRAGDYWLHDLSEFRVAFERNGFDIERSFTCFRGYSDAIVARKEPKTAVMQGLFATAHHAPSFAAVP